VGGIGGIDGGSAAAAAGAASAAGLRSPPSLSGFGVEPSCFARHFLGPGFLAADITAPRCGVLEVKSIAACLLSPAIDGSTKYIAR
jgi:hypothetical protein